jgi:hypothetical protein
MIKLMEILFWGESMIKKSWFFLLVFIFIGSASSLGITPGKINIPNDLKPGDEFDIHFSIINSDKQPHKFLVFVRGDLNQSLKAIGDQEFRMNEGEYERDLTYKLTIPSGFSPGSHLSEIVVLQIPETAGSGQTLVGGTVAVALQIDYFIPFPDKYAEAEFAIIQNKPKVYTFVVPIFNKGKLKIVRAKALIDIYDMNNEKVDSFMTNEIPLDSLERREVFYVWETNASPGNYRAKATVLYDEKTINLEKIFAIGQPILEIRGIEVNDFALGEIAKFEMLVESKWSDSVLGAYAQTNVYDKGEDIMADFKSATYDFMPLQSQIIISFWDTEGVDKGKYDASVFLNYLESLDRRDFQFEINEDSFSVVGSGYVISERGGPKGDYTITLLFILIGVLILVNVLWFLYFRKRLSGGGKR